FDALLTDDLWRQNALHANRMAKLLEAELRGIRGVTLTQPVEANGVFARFPVEVIAPLQQEAYFYEWDEKAHEVRLMCSFDTTEEEIRRFASRLRALLA